MHDSGQRNPVYSIGTAIMHITETTCLEFALAGSDALDPRMTKLCVTGISTLLEPSTAASATTEFARFLGNATLGTPVATGR